MFDCTLLSRARFNFVETKQRQRAWKYIKIVTIIQKICSVSPLCTARLMIFPFLSPSLPSKRNRTHYYHCVHREWEQKYHEHKCLCVNSVFIFSQQNPFTIVRVRFFFLLMLVIYASDTFALRESERERKRATLIISSCKMCSRRQMCVAAM